MQAGALLFAAAYNDGSMQTYILCWVPGPSGPGLVRTSLVRREQSFDMALHDLMVDSAALETLLVLSAQRFTCAVVEQQVLAQECMAWGA